MFWFMLVLIVFLVIALVIALYLLGRLDETNVGLVTEISELDLLSSILRDELRKSRELNANLSEETQNHIRTVEMLLEHIADGVAEKTSI